jgi:dihydrofolate reductase
VTRLALIAALADNRVIGRDNRLPWRLSADLRHFKTVTMGKPVIMGRNTYESIGKPLPGRSNIVLTRDPHYQAPGCQVVHSLDQALEAAAGHAEVMVIGGAQLYRQAIDRAKRLYLTRVKADVEGDTLFPEFDPAQWRELDRESHRADDKNEHDYEFITLERTGVA